MQKKQGNIKVYCRFRPFNKKQIQNHSQKLHRIANKTQLIIKSDKQDDISFMFDHIFDMISTQQDVFQLIGAPVLQNILDGFNGTIMAYGQTSSGKTHTMQGYDMTDKECKGIMPRIVSIVKTQVEKLFSAIQKSTESIQFKIKVSIFQLYMEKVRDLLDVSKNDLKIRQNKNGPFIENLSEVYVSEKTEIFKLIHLGQKNRITCQTNMNEHSSRSHMIFLLSLNQFNNQDSSSKTSNLYLIDLAGSQKVSKTGAQGKVLEQAKKINLSLTNLGKVIKNLAQKSGHIPYRDSRLTRILKNSLGGNSKTTLIVTCSPHQMHLSQTISTLRFGQNAQKIKNKPKINRELTVHQLEKIIEKLEEEIKFKDTKILFLQKYIKETYNGKIPDSKQILKGLTSTGQPEQKEQCQKLQSQVESTVSQDQAEHLLQQSQDFGKFKQTEPLQKKYEQKQDESYYTTRISELQSQLSTINASLNKQSQKYHQLKKQYAQLHENLSSILKENIEIQQIKSKIEKDKFDLEQKLHALEYQIAIKQSVSQYQKQSTQSSKSSNLTETVYQHQLENQLIQNNSFLIKMIVGQIFSIIGPYQEQQIIKVIQNDHWYKQIMVNGVNCLDFYEQQKQKLNQQIQQFIKNKQAFENNVKKYQQNSQMNLYVSDPKYSALQQQFRLEKVRQNEKVITLQNKLDNLFEQYHKMISLQTSWKAQCQLYERKLKKKQQKIIKLESSFQQLLEQISYLEANNCKDYEDTKSVKSKIIKPLKGGVFLFK